MAIFYEVYAVVLIFFSPNILSKNLDNPRTYVLYLNVKSNPSHGEPSWKKSNS